MLVPLSTLVALSLLNQLLVIWLPGANSFTQLPTSEKLDTWSASFCNSGGANGQGCFRSGGCAGCSL